MAPIPTGEQPKGLDALGHQDAFLFDVYGTLVISASGDIDAPSACGSKTAMQDLLRRFSIAKTPDQLRQSLIRSVIKAHEMRREQGIEYPEVDIVQIWQNVLGMDDIARLKAFAREYEMIVNPIGPMPGLREMLCACRQQKIMLGLISNAQFYTLEHLETLLEAPLASYGFDKKLTLFSYRFGVAKPSPIMFEIAAQYLLDCGVPASSVLYVGNDMRNDILPSKAVGFQTALFAGDRRSLRKRAEDERCRQLRPDMVITDLRQLISPVTSASIPPAPV